MASSSRDVETPADPLEDYRRALACYDDHLLATILADMGQKTRRGSLASRQLVQAIAERVADPKFLNERLPLLTNDTRLALAFFSLQDTCSIPLAAVAFSLHCLRISAALTIGDLLRQGLVAAWRKEEGSFFWVYSFRALLDDLDDGEGPPGVRLFIHPALRAACGPVCPESEPDMLAGTVIHERHSDGLEPVLRLAALWQRVVEGPLRLTQQGMLYKRDRDRLADDPALAGAIADAVSPLVPMVDLWLELGQALGVLVSEPSSEELHAAPAEFWAASAPKLPELTARRWLTLRTWHETEGSIEKHDDFPSALPFTRMVLMLLLAAAPADRWVRLDALCVQVDRASSRWRRALFMPGRQAIPPRPPEARPGGSDGDSAPPPCDPLLEAVLLGAAYPLGLVRAAEEVSSCQRAVQLTPLGRHILGMGPAPAPRASVERFLYVQPNFEVVAYRQGIDPAHAGQLCRFARITRVGAALELKLTPESIYHGLESGLSPEEMLEQLTRQSARPLPAGVAEAVRTWSGRRDRLTYYSAATMIEFATPHDLELALADWPAAGTLPPARITDRLLLVEDETAIPFHRFRQAGARDYKRPAEVCIDVEPDGITLTLDLAHSDLLVDAELGRFADERPARDVTAPNARARRQFAITQESLARAAASGFSAAQLAEWFEKRTGRGLPPAVGLLLHAQRTDPAAFRAAQPLVLLAPSPELLDGLEQHPATRDLLGERIGPTAVIIPDESLAPVQAALAALGLMFDLTTIQAARNARIKR